MACHHLAKVGGHRYYSSRDIFLVFQEIKQGYIMPGSVDYNKWSSSRLVTTLPNLVVIGTIVLEK